jgi:hypothetical protein
MPKIAFVGFPPGKVRLKVSQADATVEDTLDLADDTPETVQPPPPPPPPPPPDDGGDPGDDALDPAPYGASVRLSSTRGTGTAPAGFFFTAKASGFGVDDHYYDVRYRWTFSDEGWYTRHDGDDLPWGRYFEVDGETVLVEDGSVPDGERVRFLGNDKNVAFGPHVTHVFERPGTYTVTCEVRKRGHRPVRETMRVTVKDPADEFPGRDTICVSARGDYAGAPDGAVRVRTWLEASKEARSGPKKRILFRRGERHDHPDRTARDVSRSGGWENLQYGAFGSGPPPLFTGGGFFLKANASGECAAWGLDFRGSYDPCDPWKTRHGSVDAFYVYGKAKMTTIWDCSAAGAKNLILVANDGQNFVLGNFHGYDWNNYGYFANRDLGYAGLCGVWMKQNPNTVIGPGKFEKDPPYYQDHAPFRCSALGNPVAFNLCDLRSVGSWAGYYQPCLRIGRSPGGMKIEEAVMDRIRGENGSMLGTGNSGSKAYPRKYLWDKIYSLNVNEGGNGTLFSPNVSGLHFRNVVVAIPDTPKIGTGNLRYWIQRAESRNEDQPEIRQFGVTLMNSTLVDLRTTHPMAFDTDQMKKDYGFVRIVNNVVHAPNKDDPTDTHDTPLDDTPMWRPTNPGIRYESTSLQKSYATDPRTAAWYRPLAGSKAKGGAAGSHVAVDDFFGRVRSARTSRGAFD